MPPMPLPRRSVQLLAALLVVVACRGSAPAPPGAEGEAPIPVSAMLSVDNRSDYVVRFYVLRGNQRHRLGNVPAGSQATFELVPSVIDREIAFFADPVGFNRTQRTDYVLVRPGQSVKVELARELRSHFLSVY